jgi:hypothetical protein
VNHYLGGSSIILIGIGDSRRKIKECKCAEYKPDHYLFKFRQNLTFNTIISANNFADKNFKIVVLILRIDS